jgi:hypothetical protein
MTRKGGPVSADYDTVRKHTGCPTCSVNAGEDCHTVVSGVDMRLVHQGRIAQYQRNLRRMRDLRNKLRAG